MTSMYPGQMEPWQNRPSLIACWEHALSAFDLSGNPITSISTSMEGLGTTSVNVCISRACRLTRMCFVYAYNDTGGGGGTFDYTVSRSPDCGVSFPTSVTVAVPVGNGGFAQNCLCVDVSLLFDECDTYRSLFDFTPVGNLTFPIFRVMHHFELR